MFKLLRRLWIPLVIVLVFATAAFGVWRLHGIFGSDNINTAAGIKDDSQNIIPKDIVYEITGPAGTTGEVNFLDERSQPQRAEFTTLPWSFKITTTMTSIFANVVAQGDSDNIGCRIIVDGVVRDQQSVNLKNGQTFCLVKSA